MDHDRARYEQRHSSKNAVRLDARYPGGVGITAQWLIDRRESAPVTRLVEVNGTLISGHASNPRKIIVHIECRVGPSMNREHLG